MEDEYNSDQLSVSEDKFDRLDDLHSNKDRDAMYLDRGMVGKSLSLVLMVK